MRSVGSPVPVLVVQGSADTINVPACDARFYDTARSPKYYLGFSGATHDPPYTAAGTGAQDVVAQVTTDFFDAALAGRSTGIAGDVAGATEVSNGSSAPPVTSACRGAP